MRLYIGIWGMGIPSLPLQPSGVEFCIGLIHLFFHSELLLFQNIWGSRPRVCNHMSTSFQEHSPRICRLWCGNPEMHSSLHFSHGASGCCWETSGCQHMCSAASRPAYPFLQLLLRSHSQLLRVSAVCLSWTATCLQAFCAGLTLCLSYPAEQATGTPRGAFSDPAANTTPSFLLWPQASLSGKDLTLSRGTLGESESAARV